MHQKQTQIVILTERKYVQPKEQSAYVKNVLWEDQLVQDALEKKGYWVERKSWDDTSVDWSALDFALFRTTWDYFDRFDEFMQWFSATQYKTQFVNSEAIILWNMDKHYLKDANRLGVNIPYTIFIKQGDTRTLEEICTPLPFQEFILKPCVSGAGRHTYLIHKNELNDWQEKFSLLNADESFMVQEFQQQIKTKGEISLMFFQGEFSHAVLKKAKAGDFRVQDDFGGTVQKYEASVAEIEFGNKALLMCPSPPLYARVDVFWDNQNQLCLGELELIEPEMWFRFYPETVHLFADHFDRYIKTLQK